PGKTSIWVRGSRFRREMHSHVRGEQQRGMGLAPHQLRLGALQLRRDKERRFRTAAALTKRRSLNRVLVTWPGELVAFYSLEAKCIPRHVASPRTRSSGSPRPVSFPKGTLS